MRTNSFAQIDSIAAPNWKRNAFDLSHWKRMSANIAEAIPTLILETVPGDSFLINQEILTRWSPLLSPVYENFKLYTHFFKVPYYMIMRETGSGTDSANAGWDQFLTGDPEDQYALVQVPYLEITDANKAYFYEGTLADYLEYPVTDSGVTIHANAQVIINMFRALAYRLIYDTYYRDQNLMEDLATDMGGYGVNYPYGNVRNWSGSEDHILKSRPMPVCWEKDYFTSALPYAHDPNNTSVELDLDVTGGGAGSTLSFAEYSGSLVPDAGDAQFDGSTRYLRTANSDRLTLTADPQTGIVPTLEILELRRTEALFTWYEAMNRGGHRYEEHMFAVYGVKVQRPRNVPIYLGGSVSNIKVSEVLSSAEALVPSSDAISTPLGGFAGRSVTYGKTKSIKTYCDEHSIIMGISFIRHNPAIGWQGVNRHITKRDREDFFIPHLQGIGDQSILNKEIYWDMPDSTTDLPDTVFGYAPRYSEYKFNLNTIHADMRSSLNFWHCARTFTDTPSLNETFVKTSYSSTDFHRIFVNTTTSDDKLWMFIHNYVKAIRPMRKYDYGQR